MENFSMISIAIDVHFFGLSAYYNEKMDSLEFFKNVGHRYIVVDH
jgi:hypothetical protein